MLHLLFCMAANCYSQAPSYCATNRFTDVATFDSSVVRMDTNVVYGVAQNFFTGANDTLRMNIFFPDTAADTMSARPFILLIHGGAFMAGNMNDMNFQCMEFARRGFVTATISYRLGWNCSGTDFLSICILCGNLGANIMTATYQAAQDGRAAMRYIHANHSQYKINSGQYFIGGTSAGSITAMHVAYWDQQEADSFCPWAAGQVGLLDTSGNSLPNTFQLKGVIDNCGAVSKDSVVLNNGNIPMISFHDEGDCIVPNQYGRVISCACQSFYPAAGSSALHGKLSAAGICTSMNLVPLSINHCSFPEYELVRRASCFVRAVLCDSCQTTSNNTPFVLQHCSSGIGIAEYNSLSSIGLFPNPAGENFNLQGLLPEKEYFIMLFDLSGRKIFEEIVLGVSQHTIHSAHICPGAYLLKIITGKESRAEKIIFINNN